MANSLNKITTKSILDATIATADIADDAVTADKLANAINTDIAGKAVLTGSTNNTITTVTGANAIQGEANLTFDGDVLTASSKLVVSHDDWNVARIVNTNADANGAYLDLVKDSASPADSDQAGVIRFRADDDAGNEHAFANIIVTCPDVSNGAEDGQIEFQTSSGGTVAERVRIESGGDVGIGTTSPNGKLHVNGGDGLLVERSSGTSVAGFKQTGSSAMNIYFQNSGSTNHPSIGSSNQDLTIGTNNNERLRVLSGGGLTFNGDTAAANGLDDYEEGTFTAAFRVEGQSSNVGTSTEEGKYTKIGNVCTIWTYVVLDGAPSGTAAGNAWEIRNLPFTSASDTDHQSVGNARCHNLNNSGSYGSDVQFIPRIWNSTTVGRLEAYDQGDYTIRNASSYMQDNASVMITITYCCA